jgi:hypothetical protein
MVAGAYTKLEKGGKVIGQEKSEVMRPLEEFFTELETRVANLCNVQHDEHRSLMSCFVLLLPEIVACGVEP